MKKVLIFLITISFVIPMISVKAEENSSALAPNAKSAILLEESTGEILYEFNSHEKLEPPEFDSYYFSKC